MAGFRMRLNGVHGLGFLGVLLLLSACGSDGGETPPPAAPPASVTLTVATAGGGTGVVTSNPAGINCGTACTLTVASGTVVTLTAAPAPSNTLTDWGGLCPAGSATCAVTVTANQTVTATFNLSSANPTLGFTFTGTGSGTVTCNGGACNASYPWGTSVTLSDVANANSSFAGWSGGGCSGMADCTVLLWADTQLTAIFNLLPVTAQFSVNRTGSGTGTVMSVPAGIDCGTTCAANFPGGTAVTLTASAAAGSTFAGWTGGGCTGIGICDVTLNANTAVTATFNTIPPTATLTTATSGTGTGTITCNGGACQASYPSGTALTIVAIPAATSLFVGWNGECAATGTAATCNLTVNANSAVSAIFNLPTLAVVLAGTGSVTSSPAGINCGATCTALFNKGTSVTLTVTGAGFSGWSGGGCAGMGTCVITLNADVIVTATLSMAGLPCPAVPTLVKDINPGIGNSYPGSLVDVNGTLFFSASTQAAGIELWKSDGTVTGTTLVRDIGPGINTSAHLIPQYLTNVTGTLFFAMDDGVHGLELWKSDGTEAGTLLVKDIHPGPDSGFHFLLTDSFKAVGNTLFFTANDGVHGNELWKSDGTEAGTVMVRDIRPGAIDSTPHDLTNVDGTLFFVAGDSVAGEELFRSDGTLAGTTLVKDIASGGGSSLILAGTLESSDGILYFTAGNPEQRLWRSDGTPVGTFVVRDLNGESIPNASQQTNVNGTLFFTATSSGLGRELWRSGGTLLGTQPVKDIVPGSRSSSPRNLTNVGGRLFFSVFDSDYYLWISDGTEGGTTKLAPGGMTVPDPANGSPLITDVDGVAFFRGNWVQSLWKSDGTVAGTVSVHEGVAPLNLARVSNTLFYSAVSDNLGRELWMVCGRP